MGPETVLGGLWLAVVVSAAFGLLLGKLINANGVVRLWPVSIVL